MFALCVLPIINATDLQCDAGSISVIDWWDVSRILQRTVDNNLIKNNFTYFGRSEGKHAFASFKLKSVVIGI